MPQHRTEVPVKRYDLQAKMGWNYCTHHQAPFLKLPTLFLINLLHRGKETIRLEAPFYARGAFPLKNSSLTSKISMPAMF